MNRLTILGVCLVLSLFVTGAYGHGEGKCFIETNRNGVIKGFIKISHLTGEDLEGFAHGHVDQYHDMYGNPTGQAKGFFAIDFDNTDSDSFADCPPVRMSKLSPEHEHDDQNEVKPSTPVNIYDPPETEPRPVHGARTSSSSQSESVQVTIPIPIKTVEVSEEVIEEINEVAEEIIEEVIPKTYRFEYGYWYQGYNLVSFPVLPEGVITIKDLFDKYSLFTNFELVNKEPLEYTGDRMTVNIDGDWLSYSGESDNPIGDIEITPYMGVALLMDYAAWIAMNGRRLIGDGIYGVQAGMNFLGITQMPVGINKPSDFLLIDGVEAVISRVITDLGQNSNWYLIGRVGDPGDEYPVALGQAYLIISSSAGGIIEFEDVVNAAPIVTRSSNLVTTWGSLKSDRD